MPSAEALKSTSAGGGGFTNWVKTHKGLAIGIGIGVGVLLILIIVGGGVASSKLKDGGGGSGASSDSAGGGGEPSEVFMVLWSHFNKNRVSLSNVSDLKSLVASKGWTVAKESQLDAAYAKGASWCSAGFIVNSSGALMSAYPFQPPSIPNACTAGTNKATIPEASVVSALRTNGFYAGVMCYGKKPKPSEVIPAGTITRFSNAKWSQHDA